MIENGFYYLAGPHKGTSEQETYRIEMSLKLTVGFLTQGIYVFSPIVYSVRIAEALKFASTEERRQIVFPYLLNFLKVSKGMILVTMEGWKDSWGVQQELKFCQETQIPVYKIDPDQIPSDLFQVLSSPLNQEQLAHLLKAT